MLSVDAEYSKKAKIMISSWGQVASLSRLNSLAMWSAVALVCMHSYGCGGGDNIAPSRPGYVLAEGDVLVDSAPLDRARITFIPESLSTEGDQDKWHAASIVDGSFRIEVPPGDYVVRIQKYEQKGYEMVPTLPEQYDTETTLSATVTEDNSSRLSFELISNP